MNQEDPPISPPLDFPAYRLTAADLTDTDIAAWTAYRKHVGAGDMLTRRRLGQMRARIDDHGLDQFLALSGWLATSKHDRAVYLRKRADPVTALRPENFLNYLELMGKEAAARAKRHARPSWVPENCTRSPMGHWLHPDGSWVKCPHPLRIGGRLAH